MNITRRGFNQVLAATPLVGVVAADVQKEPIHIFLEIHLGPNDIPEFPLSFTRTKKRSYQYYWKDFSKDYPIKEISKWGQRIVEHSGYHDKVVVPMFKPTEEIDDYCISLLNRAIKLGKKKDIFTRSDNKLILYKGDEIGLVIL